MGSILIYVCKLMYVCIHGQCPRAHSILDYVHDLDEEEEEFRTVEARRGVRAHKRPAARAGIPDACARLLMCSAVVDVWKHGYPGRFVRIQRCCRGTRGACGTLELYIERESD